MQPIAEWIGYRTQQALNGGPARFGAKYLRLDVDEPTEARFCIPDDQHLVCVHLSGAIDWSMRTDDRRYRRPCLPGTLCLARAGETAWATYGDAHADFVHFYVPTLLIDAYLEADGFDPKRLELSDPANRQDPAITLIARQAVDLMSSEPATHLLFDAAALTLVSRLLGNWSNLRGERPPTESRFMLSLRDWRVRRAIDYLEAHLADDIGLDALAKAVGLTPSRLTTLFRAATGDPPHRWLMRRRVERACEMLCGSGPSVTEIAFACGFASSQHLATAFRKQMGTTPSAYRRDRLS